jgi:hypothetical protein
VKLPEVPRVAELNFVEGNVGEASETLQKISRWRFSVTEVDLREVELGVVDEFVVLADFEESFACLTRREPV